LSPGIVKEVASSSLNHLAKAMIFSKNTWKILSTLILVEIIIYLTKFTASSFLRRPMFSENLCCKVKNVNHVSVAVHWTARVSHVHRLVITARYVKTNGATIGTTSDIWRRQLERPSSEFPLAAIKSGKYLDLQARLGNESGTAQLCYGVTKLFYSVQKV
jgi:hypothetical protein